MFGISAAYWGPLVALVGACLSFAAATFVKFWLDSQREKYGRHAEAKALADALRGEVLAVRSQLKQYREMADGYVGSIRKRLNNPGVDPSIKDSIERMRADLAVFQHVSVPVYSARVGDIGLIWNRLAREVVEFYGRLEALKHFGIRVGHAHEEKFHYRVLLFADECHALIWEATKIAERLLELSQDERYRGKRPVRYPEKRPVSLNGLLHRSPWEEQRERNAPPPLSD